MKKINHSIQLLGEIPYLSIIKEDGEVVSIPLVDFLKEGKSIGVVEITSTRTMAQNRAIHVLFARISNKLNEVGLSLHKVLFNNQNKKINTAFAHAIKTYPQHEDFFVKMRAFIGDDAKEIEWSGSSVKELIWRPYQKAITGKTSTTTLDKSEEITQIYTAIAKKMADDFGLDTGDFPNWESLVSTKK